jgi:hypothetical protein
MATAAIADDSFLEEEAPAAVAAAKAPARSARTTSATTSGRKRVTVEDEVPTEGAGWKLMIIAASLILLVGSLAAFDAVHGERQGPWGNIANLFQDKAK